MNLANRKSVAQRRGSLSSAAGLILIAALTIGTATAKQPRANSTNWLAKAVGKLPPGYQILPYATRPSASSLGSNYQIGLGTMWVSQPNETSRLGNLDDFLEPGEDARERQAELASFVSDSDAGLMMSTSNFSVKKGQDIGIDVAYPFLALLIAANERHGGTPTATVVMSDWTARLISKVQLFNLARNSKSNLSKYILNYPVYMVTATLELRGVHISISRDLDHDTISALSELQTPDLSVRMLNSKTVSLEFRQPLVIAVRISPLFNTSKSQPSPLQPYFRFTSGGGNGAVPVPSAYALQFTHVEVDGKDLFAPFKGPLYGDVFAAIKASLKSACIDEFRVYAIGSASFGVATRLEATTDTGAALPCNKRFDPNIRSKLSRKLGFFIAVGPDLPHAPDIPFADSERVFDMNSSSWNDLPTGMQFQTFGSGYVIRIYVSEFVRRRQSQNKPLKNSDCRETALQHLKETGGSDLPR